MEGGGNGGGRGTGGADRSPCELGTVTASASSPAEPCVPVFYHLETKLFYLVLHEEPLKQMLL